jgi:hypothetical protein
MYSSPVMHELLRKLQQLRLPVGDIDIIGRGDAWQKAQQLGELKVLINAAEAIVSRGRTETPNLMLIRQRTDRSVGKVSEIKKELTGKTG